MTDQDFKQELINVLKEMDKDIKEVRKSIDDIFSIMWGSVNNGN